jgi:hypothetical protein
MRATNLHVWEAEIKQPLFASLLHDIEQKAV